MQSRTVQEDRAILSPSGVAEILTTDGVDEKCHNESKMNANQLTNYFMKEIVVLSCVHTQHCCRMTLKPEDVKFAMEQFAKRKARGPSQYMQVKLEDFDKDKEWEKIDDENNDTCMDSDLDEEDSDSDRYSDSDTESSDEEERWTIESKEYPTTFFDIMFPPLYESDNSKLSDTKIFCMAKEIMQDRGNDPPIKKGTEKCLGDALQRYLAVACVKPSVATTESWFTEKKNRRGNFY